MTKLNLFLSLAVILVLSCQNNSKSISKNTGDQHSAEMLNYSIPDVDHGTLQSPINILTNQSQSGKHHIELNFDGKINKVENLGHTVQLDFKPGTNVKYEDNIYEFVQLHFHTPSEHLIDGITYPMEMHIVNKLKSSKNSTDSTQKYLVIGVLFKMGKPNKFVEEFINLIPEHNHEEIEISEDLVHLEDMFNQSVMPEESNFYHYDGSLTTPPYTESVDWFVLKQILTASPKEIQKINSIEGNNARHVQALFGREIKVE
ncbi:carbonic anhydrase family protein [Flavobacteriaceae bacterium 14752]|uniref:carbonic anhydrase family protein n=1 Tax=Mesohalobacter salilacus TaxID=2491711 RepID=UPI000F63BFED|nr:carbonic anhydrase family protein [Flavobacteriaceae bacterium 14752]